MLTRVLAVLTLSMTATASWAQSATQAPDAAAPVVAVANAAPTDVEAFIKAETKGGELDFGKILATKKQTMFLHDGGMYTKQEYALVLWGMRVKALGVESAERACALYAAVNQRTMSSAEKQAVTNGFASGTRE